MNDKLKYIVVNGALAGALIAGTFYGITGIINILGGFLIFASILMCSTLYGLVADVFEKKTIKALGERPVFGQIVDFAYDVIFTCVLLWFGHWFVAIVYVLANILTFMAKEFARLEIEERS